MALGGGVDIRTRKRVGDASDPSGLHSDACRLGVAEQSSAVLWHYLQEVRRRLSSPLP